MNISVGHGYKQEPFLKESFSSFFAQRQVMLLLGWLLISPWSFGQVTIKATERTEIDRAFARMYNYDFQGAQLLVDQHLARHPEDPLGYNVRAAALLFQELGRLQILESEFFSDDDRVGGKKKPKPDPALKQRFEQALDAGKVRAEALLQKEPGSADALFHMSFNVGLRSDYLSLIEKRYVASLSLIKESDRFAKRCIAINPNYGDAYLTTGLTEYIIGSVPFYLRWAVKFDNVKGSKTAGMEILKKVIRNGRYLAPFAKIMLALAHLRDKKPALSADLLATLAADYPENKLIQTELEKVRQLAQKETRVGK
jgi:hypothetical protein